MKKKKLLFLTGTRADYGKLKSLLKQVESHAQFDLYLFVTGMHMLSKYGSTWKEIEKDGFQNTYHYINQKSQAQMDITLSNTILGLSNYIHEIKPDIIVIHGDRLEALAGAMVGAFNNISVVHIEGGEVSGTIDESIRHAISKFAHVHLVSNEQAKKRIIQLGEKSDMIHVIGSPDIDIMLSSDLPQLQEVKERYEIKFDTYSILMYHPVTTNLENLQLNIKNIIKALLQTDRNYIIIFPNNDEGSQIILDEYAKLEEISKIKLFPSMRFEYFLTLLKNADFLIGNSSTGIRETEVYGIPTIDLGNRQEGRYLPEVYANLVHCNEVTDDILKAIRNLPLHQPAYSSFGEGESDNRFIELIQQEDFWNITLQKKFVDQIYLTSR
ncbi:UDP-N-acetylglucosamine 2-epimerase [Alkalicoccobacillus murimartini]|uniref:UDP-N-acetylglucosamine 2-epimerase (Hydrolyzing) n=1 Tax=Alkalicoccobacillus murimartini TaxID=171685 RepID=A0ABT9YGE3_9BACI|nr:UDP-N-acetylglucosamine 2-epimerase [Alkalicoccobacillus murimartini]MDQ0206931.1 UDP-N-acetylglucosamine 2-epimerase (hydrolyzing) [Alkalicoccobacillus murimartini]